MFSRVLLFTLFTLGALVAFTPGALRSSSGEDVGGAPATSIPFEIGETQRLVGEVVKVEQAGPYTYISYVPRDEKRRWLATLKTNVAIGSSVEVLQYAQAQQFKSKRLGRTFQTLGFGSISSPLEDVK